MRSAPALTAVKADAKVKQAISKEGWGCARSRFEVRSCASLLFEVRGWGVRGLFIIFVYRLKSAFGYHAMRQARAQSAFVLQSNILKSQRFSIHQRIPLTIFDRIIKPFIQRIRAMFSVFV